MFGWEIEILFYNLNLPTPHLSKVGYHLDVDAIFRNIEMIYVLSIISKLYHINCVTYMKLIYFD